MNVLNKLRLLTSLARTFSSKSLLQLLKEMPKEMVHSTVLRKQRVKLKEKSQKYSPGILSLQVIGSGAKGAPKSLYLFSDQSRYLFNCGEGTQRLAHEHKMKLAKLEHIFITNVCWENVGGLPGVALTIQDVGVPEIVLHGPEGVEQIFSATRNFVILRNLAIKTAKCEPNRTFEDNAITVKYIPLVLKSEENFEKMSAESESASDEENNIDYYAHERYTNKKDLKKKLNKKKHYKPKEERLTTMCYAVKLKTKPGSLCLQKCVEFGVPPGPLLGKLKNGEDVVLDNGVVVRSADVTEPDFPGPLFLVIDCPNEEYLNKLITETAFHEYQSNNATEDNMPVLIAHFSPPEIMENPMYKEWMSKFRFSTQHIVLNEANDCMGSIAVHRIQHKLNLVDPSMFPLLNDNVLEEGSEVCQNSNGETKEFLLTNARTFTTFNLRPKLCLNDSIRVKVNPKEYKMEVTSIDGMMDKLTDLKNKFTSTEEIEKDHPNLVFLGTGSCIPNKVRNTSAILLTMSDESSILLDCGEGTYGQLVRHFGPDQVEKVLSRLQAVYISHLHADHHIGLVGLLKALLKFDLDKKIYLLAPKQIMYWLNFYNRHFESILNCVKLIPNSEMIFDKYSLNNETKEELLKDLNLEKLETSYAIHCPNAFGVSLTHKDGWKLTYSGDTMPSDALIKIGDKSTVLIHEATMEDELLEEAKIKLHSTTSQAIEVGRKMEADYTILTHFSQRYAKIPRLEANSFDKNVGIAFDNMKIKFTDLPKLHHLYPILKMIFHEDSDDLEQKALKRQKKQERENLKKLKIEGINAGDIK